MEIQVSSGFYNEHTYVVHRINAEKMRCSNSMRIHDKQFTIQALQRCRHLFPQFSFPMKKKLHHFMLSSATSLLSQFSKHMKCKCESKCKKTSAEQRSLTHTHIYGSVYTAKAIRNRNGRSTSATVSSESYRSWHFGSMFNFPHKKW